MLRLHSPGAMTRVLLLALLAAPGCHAASEAPTAEPPAPATAPARTELSHASGVPGFLLAPEDHRFDQLMKVLRRQGPALDDQASASPRPETLALDDSTTVRLAIVFHDTASGRREATALSAALPLAVRSVLLPGSQSTPESDAVDAVARAAGLADSDPSLAVVLLARNDATAWVMAATGDTTSLVSATLAMTAMVTGMSASLPAARVAGFHAPAALNDSFTLTAIPSGSTSTLRKIVSATDQPVLLTFWADWCKPCLNEMPALQRLHDEYGGRIRFVGLAHGRAQNPNLTKVVTDKGLMFPNHAFIEQALYKSVFGREMELPGLAVLEPSGRVVHVVHGAITEPAAMEALVARLDLLAPSSGKPIVPEGTKP